MPKLTLPSHVTSLRHHQTTALQDVLADLKDNDVVMLDAPTGSGKTLIGELTRQSLDVRGLYLCHSIALQEQFCADFPDAALLKGRSNYTTYDDPSADITAADCNKQKGGHCVACPEGFNQRMHCRWCHPVSDCPYEAAKAAAIRAPLTCTNISYFLHESNHVGNLTMRRGLVIVDEADVLEDEIMRFVEVRISERRAAELSIESPAKRTVESAWVDWAVGAYDRVKDLERRARSHNGTLAEIRRHRYLERLVQNVARLLDPSHGLATGGWIYTGYDRGDISFKPVRVDHLADTFLWRHAPKWLLMSATTVSFSAMADALGL